MRAGGRPSGVKHDAGRERSDFYIRNFRAHVLLGATVEERSIAQPVDLEI